MILQCRADDIEQAISLTEIQVRQVLRGDSRRALKREVGEANWNICGADVPAIPTQTPLL